MRLPETVRRSWWGKGRGEPGEAPDAARPIRASLRVDRRTKNLVGRLRPGEIALIDHVDLDRVAADSLIATGVAAVLNAQPSISGRYPTHGPEALVRAGVALIDGLGEELLVTVRDGDEIVIDGGAVRRDGVILAHGVRQDAGSIARAMAEARENLSVQLELFAANTMEYLRRERELLLDGVGLPETRTPMRGRHCLIVVRGNDYRDDLFVLRPYIRQFRPVLIGVDGGADALIEAGYTPHVIVGDMDSVSDSALRCGAELIVHAYPDGRAPGLVRICALNLPATTFPAAATSEDIAMLLADGNDAELIVAVGTHATLGEFLDKGRSGMASTFLTRLKVGGKLVDAKGVSRLYRGRRPGKGRWYSSVVAQALRLFP
jgi:uncharacterized membrane-anchored protein